MLKDVANDVKGVVNGLGSVDGGSSSKRSGSSSSGGVNGFIDGVVANVDKLLGTKSDDESNSIPMIYVGVPATLSIVDTVEHGPVIEIQATDLDAKTKQQQSSNNSNATEEENSSTWWQDPLQSNHNDKLPKKSIPLYLVYSISAGWSLLNDQTAGGVKLFAAPTSKGFLSAGSGQELLRFDTLGGGGDVLSNAFFPVKSELNKYSDKVIGQLRALIEWNRRRIAADIKKGRVGIAQTSSTNYVAMT